MVGGTSEGASHSEGFWTTFRGGEIVQAHGTSYARVAAPTDVDAVHPCAHGEVTHHQCGLNGVRVGETSSRRLVAKTPAPIWESEADAEATVLSIDGIGAYDHVHRSAMLNKLLEIPGVRATTASPLVTSGRI